MCRAAAVFPLLLLAGPAAAATLANDQVRADFDARGLVAIAMHAPAVTIPISRDGFAITIDGRRYDAATLPPPSQQLSGDAVSYVYTSGPIRLRVRYTLPTGAAYVRKAITVLDAPGDRYRLDEVVVFALAVGETPTSSYVHGAGRANLGLGDNGAALRFGADRSLLALAQNPFLRIAIDGATLAVAYRPDMAWHRSDGPFTADAGVLAPVRLSGRRLAAEMQREWTLAPPAARDGLDEAEVAAFTAVVRSALLYTPARPTNVFVGWCVNDYQIDIATDAGRTEYTRVIDRAVELGAEHVLFAPTNTDVAKRDDSTDDWRWENLLWLSLGQRIRKGTWNPAADPLPANVIAMRDYARRRKVGLLAYVYPVLAFEQDPSWLVTRPHAGPNARRYASLGVRAFQDWLIDTLVTFHQRSGITGYSFDHGFLVFDGPSRYAQWWGWRRVLETLRRRIPDIVIDGRQAYQHYGPWSWLAGNYPHPTYNDEQPESFVPFPDLSFDRVSAARQRYTAWQYRNHDFAPSEIVPGYITHQTPRLDDTGDMPQTKTAQGIRLDRFRARDWDYLGWRYSLLSSIATGGWNNVLNVIPARDPDEHRHFSPEDRAFFRHWIDWTAVNKELLRHTRTILGQPALGKADGTAAIIEDRGFVFLFNPNARRVRAELALDATIGLTKAGTYQVKEIVPLQGRLIGKPGAGFWAHGDRVALDLEGQSATVLEIRPAPRVTGPLLFNAPGSATLTGDAPTLHDVRGPAGTEADLIVLAPDLVVRSLRVRFAGLPFTRAQQVGTYDPAFTGGPFSATFRVPARVFAQLDARQQAWPIPWTPEDYRTTWLAPHRLLLFVQFAEPDDTWEPRLLIDGRTIELRRAYSSIRVHTRSFVGFYADLSLLQADREYRLELALPTGLKPGQFQGVFFQNVETEYTSGQVVR